MRPSLALSIGAVFYLLFGIPLLLAPAALMSALGWSDVPTEALVPARDVGVLAIGVGIIDWLARDAVGAPLRGLLWGNIFLRVAALGVNYWELAAGMIPATLSAGIVAATGVSIALIVLFALALRRA